VLLVDEIDVLLLIGDVQDIHQHPQLVAASGQFEVIELDHDNASS
jgi:hypothetical protein